jgi:flagellar motor switch protein FliN/FliY
MSGESPTPQPGEVSQADIDAALAAAGAIDAAPASPTAPDEPAPVSTQAGDASTTEPVSAVPVATSEPPKTDMSGRPYDEAAAMMEAAIAEERAAAAAAAPASGAAMSAVALELPDLGRGAVDRKDHGIDLLSDVELNVKIELGRATMLIEDVLRLGEGSVVELDKLAGDPVDVLVNDRLVARGEVLVLNDNFCVRISEIVAGDGDAAAA